MLAMLMVIGVPGCGAEKETNEPAVTVDQPQVTEQPTEPAITELTAEPTDEPTPTIVPEMQKPDGALFIATFEDQTVNRFKGRGNERVEVSSEQAHSGQYSLKVTDRTAKWNGPSINVEKNIVPGAKCDFSVWVKSGKLAMYTVSVQEGTGSGAAYTNLTSLSFGPTHDWIELKATFRFNDTEHASIYVECADPEAEYFIDDFCFFIEADKTYVYDNTLPSLKDIYKDYFLVGNAVNVPDLSGERFEVFKQHFNSLTAANAMKPGNLSSSKGVYSFGSADSMVKTIKDAGISVHGHTLVWHNQSAKWLNDAGMSYEEARKNLEDFITNVAGHYRQDDVKLTSWDVVNEAFEDGMGGVSWKEALRKSAWYNAYANGGNGWDYVEDAFRFARAADPDAVLYYNDYNLDVADKASAVAAMVKEINDKYLAEGNDRKLVEGIGMQAHYSVKTKPEDVEASINRFISLGIEISITELDITANEGLGFTEAMDKYQAMLYARLMNIYKKYSDNIVRVTFWGLDDGTSWRAAQNPCLFNSDLSAKNAFLAVADPDGYLNSR